MLDTPDQLLPKIVGIAAGAGKSILEVYQGSDFDVETKGDGSPLTQADRLAHEFIVSALTRLTPAIPILSEESSDEVHLARRNWQTYWLVDPLDGTKEFVKRNGEFTVNIALIDGQTPILGVVHTPVSAVTYSAAQGVGAFRSSSTADSAAVSIRDVGSASVTLVASRSHSGKEVEQYRKNLVDQFGDVVIESMGSSLKICLVAEGKADVYPRLGPTSEWDTAAAHCVLEQAGGRICRLDGSPLVYNKADILNPWFLACGDPTVPWSSFAEGIKEV